MISRGELTSELLTCFPNIADGEDVFWDDFLKPVKEDLIKASLFLTDNVGMLQALKTLNLAFKAHLGEGNAEPAIAYYKQKFNYYSNLAKYQKKPPQYRGEAPVPPMKPAEMNHALVRAFTEVENEKGFGRLNERGRVPVYLKFQPSDVFNRQLGLKTHWKDPTVPKNHGEYTHRIQWYCLSKSEITFNNLPNLFSFLGSIPYPLNPQRGLWDFVCDRDGGEASFVPFKIAKSESLFVGKTKFLTDFRSPEILNIFLMNAPEKSEELAKSLEPLSSFLRTRLHKRNITELNGDSESVKKNYVAKLMYNLTYASLATSEKTEVDSVFEAGIYPNQTMQ